MGNISYQKNIVYGNLEISITSNIVIIKEKILPKQDKREPSDQFKSKVCLHPRPILAKATI